VGPGVRQVLVCLSHSGKVFAFKQSIFRKVAATIYFYLKGGPHPAGRHLDVAVCHNGLKGFEMLPAVAWLLPLSS
jgi:hypothetical protein